MKPPTLVLRPAWMAPPGTLPKTMDRRKTGTLNSSDASTLRRQKRFSFSRSPMPAEMSSASTRLAS